MGETEESTTPTNPDRRWTVSALIVPSLADSNDTDAFDTVHTVLGTAVGETFGYLLGRMADDGRGPTSPRSPSISPAAGSRSSVMRPRA